MKKVLLSLMALVVMAGFSTLQAKVVDRDEALAVATDFFRTHNIATLSTSEVREVWNSSQLTTTGVATLSATETPTFYVFAPETGKGFVIVSADDCTESILAYSDKDTFVTDNMPCGFLWWCEAMNKQIANYRETGTVSPRKAARQSGISPLASDAVELTTASWNQDAPYYNDCPMDGSSRSYTGCASTSFAIAMRYHQHPTTGSGQTEAYYTSSKNIYVASRDLSSHTYDWSNMPLEYGSNYTEAQATAVATLMADIGATLQADYTSGSTGTGVGYATPSYFYNNFGYSAEMYYASASDYSENDWTALMEDQIKNVGPVPYLSFGMEHQFILDGYNTSDQFHINWGWSGANDGYFSLPNIVEGEDSQAAIVNFKPNDGSVAQSTLSLGSSISTSTEIFSQNVSFSMDGVTVNNLSLVSFSGNIAYVLTNSVDNVKEVISSQMYIGDFPINAYVTLGNVSCTITSEINAGDIIRLGYLSDGTGVWKLMEGSEYIVDRIVISEDQIGEPGAPESEYSISVYGDGLTTSTSVFIPGVAFTTYATFADWTSDIDEVHLIVALTDSEGNVKEYISDDTNIGKVQAMYVWGSGNISCTITGEITAGDRIRMYYQANNSGYWYWFNGYGDSPREIVITDDMIGAQFYDEDSSLYFISVQGSKDVEVTWGGESSDSGTEAYAGEITIPATIDYNGTTYNVVGIGENAFRGCTLTSVSIPNSVTYLGERAFQNCDGITEISIPNSVTSIGNYSFFDCNNLQTVVIGDGVEDLGIYTFQYCSNMTSLTLGNKLSSIREYVFSSCSSLPTVDLPNSVTSLGNDALANCSALATISFGSGMQSLGSDVFDGSNAITTITVAEDNQYFSAVDNVLFNKEQTRLVLYPSGAEETEYAIPEGVTTIADHAFKGSTKLTALTFPESLTTLENYSIEGCTGVNQMTLPTNMTTIGEGAFYGCSGLGTLNTLNPTPPSFASRVFEGGPNTTVCVPAGTLAEYKRVWGEASNITGLSAYIELGYAVLKIGTTSYATYYNEDYDINLTDTGIKAYWASEIENDEDNNNVVSLVNIGTTIPAKTAVVLQGAQTDLTEASATAPSAESAYTSNMLHGQSTTGTISTESGYLYYILTTGGTNGEVGFYYGAENGGAFESAANKAWLAVPGTSPTSLSIKFKDNDTTGISSVSVGSYEGDGNIYTIQGIRVSDMSRPGVYIVNGKKILVK